MKFLRCSCGYVGEEEGFAEHLGDAFVPVGSDIGTDGQAHAELAAGRLQAAGGDPYGVALPGLACCCGFTAGERAELDEHLLAVFIPADRIGLDGEKHEPAFPIQS